MRSKEEIQKRFDEIERIMNNTLGGNTDKPVLQWAQLKAYYTAQQTLLWVLEEPEVI